MQKYGIIKDGVLSTSSKQLEGYKPIDYAVIPDTFDQTTQYIEQGDVVDGVDRITVQVEIKELPIDLSEGTNDGEII